MLGIEEGVEEEEEEEEENFEKTIGVFRTQQYNTEYGGGLPLKMTIRCSNSIGEVE